MKIIDLVSRPRWAHLTLSLFSYLDLCSPCLSRPIPQNQYLGRLHSCPAERCPFSSSSCHFASLIARCLSPLQSRCLHSQCGLSRPPRGSRCSCFAHGFFQLVNSRVIGLASRPKVQSCSRRFGQGNRQHRQRRVRMDNPDAQTSVVVIIAIGLVTTFILDGLQHYSDIAASGSPASVFGCSSIVHGKLHADQRTVHGT